MSVLVFLKRKIKANLKALILWLMYDFWNVSYLYRHRCRLKKYLKLKRSYKSKYKILYVSAIGLPHHQFIERTSAKFMDAGSDMMFFPWDESVETHPICMQHKMISDPNGLKWYYAKKYLTPDVVAGYDYIFYWDDDINILNFDPVVACQIMDAYGVQMAQPALMPKSKSTHEICYRSPKKGVRFTDFVEIMNPIFTAEAWNAFWSNMEHSWNHWGWGYDDYAFHQCGYQNMAILDCMPVHHEKSITFPWRAFADMECYDFIRGIQNRSRRVVFKEISNKELAWHNFFKETHKST